MAIIYIAAIVILGSVIYLMVTLLSYMNQSSELNLNLRETQMRLEREKQKLEDYQMRAEKLKDDLPDQRSRRDLLQRWTQLLKQQKGQLEAEGLRIETRGKNAQDAAIRKAVAAVQQRKG